MKWSLARGRWSNAGADAKRQSREYEPGKSSSKKRNTMKPNLAPRPIIPYLSIFEPPPGTGNASDFDDNLLDAAADETAEDDRDSVCSAFDHDSDEEYVDGPSGACEED